VKWGAPISNGGPGTRGRSLPLKPTKVTLLNIILYNLENNILKPIPNISFGQCSIYLFVRDMRPFCRPLFCHSSVVKYVSLHL